MARSIRKLFKKVMGERGRLLEIDRKDAANTIYDKNNCVLACYPCNNAKSDVFGHEAFEEIANAIKKEWLKMAKKKKLLDEIIKKYPLLKEDAIIK